MADLDSMLPVRRLKKPSTREIENAIADALSRLVGHEHSTLYSVSVGSMEFETFKVKMSLTIETNHERYETVEEEPENDVVTEQAQRWSSSFIISPAHRIALGGLAHPSQSPHTEAAPRLRFLQG